MHYALLAKNTLPSTILLCGILLLAAIITRKAIDKIKSIIKEENDKQSTYNTSTSPKIETVDPTNTTYALSKNELTKDETVLPPKPLYTEPKQHILWESVEWKPREAPQQYTQPKEQRKTTRASQKPDNKNSEYQGAYQAADIFTRNEAYNYKTLKEAADRKGYLICPKVRLADIITPRRDAKYMSRFGKIKSKHVDFVIYNNDMSRPIAVIELDDSSHDRKDRIERDKFVDYILEDAGYKVIHTRRITPDILDNI